MRLLPVSALLISSALSPLIAAPVPSPDDIVDAYLETLNKKLLEYVMEDNFAAAKVIGEEIQRLVSLEPTASNMAPCGTWIWVNDKMTTLFPGGKVVSDVGTATWKWLNEDVGRIQINWESGWVDIATLSEDYQTLHCRNNRGWEFDAHRVAPPDQNDRANSAQ